MLTVLSTIRKGGAGKSAIATNLAAIWAQGQPTLLIDLDTQGDASTWLDVQGTGEALGDALAGRCGLDPAIRTASSGVDVAVGGEALGYWRDGASGRGGARDQFGAGALPRRRHRLPAVA